MFLPPFDADNISVWFVLYFLAFPKYTDTLFFVPFVYVSLFKGFWLLSNKLVWFKKDKNKLFVIEIFFLLNKLYDIVS